jgi:hypothetical protein
MSARPPGIDGRRSSVSCAGPLRLSSCTRSSESRLQAQRRGRRLVRGRSRSKEDDWRVAALRANLQATNLLLTSLRHPSQHHARCVGPEQLFDRPQPLHGLVRMNPDQMTLVEPQTNKPWDMRSLGRPHHHDLLALQDQRTHGGREEPPFKNRRLHLQNFGQRTARPPTTGQFCVQGLEATAEDAGHGATQGIPPPDRGFHRVRKEHRTAFRVARRMGSETGRGRFVATHPRQGGGHADSNTVWKYSILEPPAV